LDGQWKVEGTRVVADEVVARINRLIQEHLLLLGHTSDGWSSLYRDPTDGRLWERTYPHSEMHGGGPPRLAAVKFEEAKARYGELAG